jgi:hypothetical protein
LGSLFTPGEAVAGRRSGAGLDLALGKVAERGGVMVGYCGLTRSLFEFELLHLFHQLFKLKIIDWLAEATSSTSAAVCCVISFAL